MLIKINDKNVIHLEQRNSRICQITIYILEEKTPEYFEIRTASRKFPYIRNR